MKISRLKMFFKNTELQKPFIMGYYGGGNFGDELLMEVIQNILHNKSLDVSKVSFYYSDHKIFKQYHKDFGFKLVRVSSKFSLLKNVFTSKEIILGGGGFWGVDFNKNVLLLSALFFVSRYVLFKKVYLIGIGYYTSTTKLGHVGAWLAGMAANGIIVRDKESYDNFQKILPTSKKQVISIDNDLAFYMHDFVNEDDYVEDVKEVENLFGVVKPNTVLVTIRDFKYRSQESEYLSKLRKFIKKYPTSDVRVMTLGFLTDKSVVEQKKFIKEICLICGVSERSIIEYKYNPIALYFFLQKNNKELKIFAPQFHIIIIAYLAGVYFEPIAYDNKVIELFNIIGIDEKNIIKLNIDESK